MKIRKIVWLLPLITIVVWSLIWALREDFDFANPPSLTCTPTIQNKEAVRFIAFGDWGQGTDSQMELAEAMAKQYKQAPFQAAFTMGDNFYPNGDIKKLGKAYFEEPYKPLLQAHVRFFPAIGNHDDHKDHLADQMAYFKMPGKYYKVSLENVDLFILNTTFFVRSPDQQAWLDKALSQSHATWKIVIGHHPLYSSGGHGGAEGIRQILEPLLVKHHVDFYLAGHDHDYERFKPIQGVQYIVSGGGGASLGNFKRAIPNSLVRFRTHNFLSFEVSQNQLWLQVINKHGQLIDCGYWKK